MRMDLPTSDMTMHMPVTIVIKAPNQKVADQTVQCVKSWTVRNLKEHLSNVYPNKPKENQQRIIYSGKLLQDDQTLKDVLRQYEADQTAYTVHLVCAPSVKECIQSCYLRPSSSNISASSTSSTSVVGNEALTNEDSPTNGLRQRHIVSSNSVPVTIASQRSDMSLNGQSNTNDFAGQYFTMNNMWMYGSQSAAMNGGLAYDHQQMMHWQQQMYNIQLAQYMQYLQHQNLANYVGISPTSAFSSNEAPVVQAQEPLAANGGAQVRLNAQGDQVVNDEENDGVERDWLDWIYSFSRFVFLFSILYYYSTVGRLALVACVFIFLYLLQAGGLIRRRRRVIVRRRPNNNNNDVAQERAVADVVAVGPEERENPGGAEEANGEENNNAEEQEETLDGEIQGSERQLQQRPNPLTVAWVFISTFFTSLIPQPPQPMNMD